MVAGRALASGLTLARIMPYPYAVARLLHANSEMHSGNGERAAADAALAMFQHLGARKDAKRVARAISGIGETIT